MKPVTPLTVYRETCRNAAYSWSPFVIKLEARLRFSHRPYLVQVGSRSKAPKGKLPYVRIGDRESLEDSSLVADSTLIIRKLIALGELEDLNATLSPEQKPQDLAIRALLEDKLYFISMYERWLVPENFYLVRDVGPLAPIPWPLRLLVGWMAYRQVRQTLYGQGTGRHTAVEIGYFREEAWAALDELVAANTRRSGAETPTSQNQPWILGGENPTEADACLYGFLASALSCPANPELEATVRNFPGLISYANRIHEEYFPDYSKWK